MECWQRRKKYNLFHGATLSGGRNAKNWWGIRNVVFTFKRITTLSNSQVGMTLTLVVKYEGYTSIREYCSNEFEVNTF